MPRPLLLLLIALGLAAPGLAQEDILLITLDTTRADHLSCYGYGQPTAPAIDAFAGQGVRFTRAYTPAPYTLPAHASILTGRWPKDHGMRDNASAATTLAVPSLVPLLKSKGYGTAAFVSSFVLDRRFGLAQGFDSYDDAMTLTVAGDRERNERTAPETTAQVTKYLAGLPDGGKVFLWVHFYDPHYPYVPHANTPVGMGAYDGEIRHMDRAVGAILKEWNKRRRGLTIVTADHGESLGEHGEEYHGMFLYEACVRVPLLVRAEGLKPGTTDTRPASLLDVAATLLVFARAPAPPMAGRSLLASGPLHTELYFESFIPANAFGWSPPFGILKDGLKYIHLPRPEMYDVVKDPGEKADLVRTRHAQAKELSERLRAGYGMDYSSGEGSGDAETMKRLEALGYRGGNTARPGKDPKDLIWVPGVLYEAKSAWDAGRTAEAERAYRRVLAFDGDNIPAQIEFAAMLKQAGRRGEARAILKQAVASNPRFAYALYNLALMDYEEGALDKARTALEAFGRMVPSHQDAVLLLFRISLDRKEAERAAGELERAAAIDGDSAGLWFARGRWAEYKEDLTGAAEAYARCLVLSPRALEPLGRQAEVLFKLGRVDESIAAYKGALAADPDQPALYLSLGSIYLNARDDPANALPVFEEFLRRYPDRPEAGQVREIAFELANPPR